MPNKRFIFLSTVISLIMLVCACQQPAHSANAQSISTENLGVAIFAGGCFWCTESDFDKIPGVVSTTSGYIGGTIVNPTYKQVSTGNTGHIEAVKVEFDKTRTNFSRLLEAFWPTIDPLFANGQFCDIGPQYRSAIFYLNSEQKVLAEASKSALETSGRFDRPIVTEILPATDFYMAEAYHQDYYIKNPLRYTYYRTSCGRDKRLEQLWGDNH